MERVDFNEVRGFSDSITATFNFVKQELVPLLKCFAFIALPLIFIELFFKSYVISDTLSIIGSPEVEDASGTLQSTMISNLVTALVYFWMLVMVLAYIRVYQERMVQQRGDRITAGEVWRVMCKYLLKLAGFGLVYMLIVGFGILLFIIPGIYFSIALAFTAYFIVLKDESFSNGISSSMSLVKGKWWNFFGYLIVLQLIVGGLAYVFSIPFLVLTFKSIFSQQEPGIYETTFSMMFASLGQNLLQIISIVGTGVRFYSYLEQKEHTALLEKIGQIGTVSRMEEGEQI